MSAVVFRRLRDFLNGGVGDASPARDSTHANGLLLPSSNSFWSAIVLLAVVFLDNWVCS